MKQFGFALALLSVAAICSAQQPGDFKPAETNVWGAEYPRVDATGRVEIRIKAPDAAKARVNFWSGPKVDMEKQADGFWTVITPPLVPGLHYYTLVVDGAEFADPGSHAFFGGGKHASAVEVPEPGADYYAIKDVPHGQVREVWYCSKPTGTWRHALVYLPPGYDTQTEDALSGALPAARRRRGRDRLDPAGARELHPRQPDRRGQGEADDRGDGLRLRAPRRPAGGEPAGRGRPRARRKRASGRCRRWRRPSRPT